MVSRSLPSAATHSTKTTAFKLSTGRARGVMKLVDLNCRQFSDATACKVTPRTTPPWAKQATNTIYYKQIGLPKKKIEYFLGRETSQAKKLWTQHHPPCCYGTARWLREYADTQSRNFDWIFIGYSGAVQSKHRLDHEFRVTSPE